MSGSGMRLQMKVSHFPTNPGLSLGPDSCSYLLRWVPYLPEGAKPYSILFGISKDQKTMLSIR